MAPDVYQRPTAAPNAGAIQQAEKLVEQLGIARSLERRFARLDEVQAIWLPHRETQRVNPGGVFAHLRPTALSQARGLAVPAQAITWAKFARTVLPDAKAIELNVPSSGAFVALVTAANADAPPILQWDTEEQRNPVSWYMYVKGSPAMRWQLSATWTPVTAVTLQPSMWFGDKYPHQGKGAVFLLEGARDVNCETLALFPEILKSELHGVRSVIEAHSKTGRISGINESTACGLAFKDGAPAVHVRVTGSTGVAVEYKIDRWE